MGSKRNSFMMLACSNCCRRRVPSPFSQPLGPSSCPGAGFSRRCDNVRCPECILRTLDLNKLFCSKQPFKAGSPSDSRMKPASPTPPNPPKILSWTESDKRDFVLSLYNTQQQQIIAASTTNQTPYEKAMLGRRPSVVKPPLPGFAWSVPPKTSRQTTSAVNPMTERLLALLAPPPKPQPAVVRLPERPFESLDSREQFQLLIEIHRPELLDQSVPTREDVTPVTRRDNIVPVRILRRPNHSRR
ncbi:hypothetical protein QBC43DRAFT_349133 [Cladorrhinum sp. PSN259]|nr:hypothetical protein QBC43DRAFT_349133 [Cladorrhinum sp. PSN259]